MLEWWVNSFSLSYIITGRVPLVQALAGLLADGRQIINTCREEAVSYKRFYGQPIPGKMLNQR